MNLTDSQALPFPDCDDPGDGALQLQLLAEAIDAKLVDQFARFRSIVNRPAFVAGLNAPQPGYPTGISSIPWEREVYNSAITSGIVGSSGITFFQTGYWMVGAYLHSNPSGGVTANSLVYARLLYRGTLVAPIGGVNEELWISTNYQSSTGGEHQVVTALVRQEYDGTADFSGGGAVSLQIDHQNAASTITIQQPTLIWGFKVCDLEDM